MNDGASYSSPRLNNVLQLLNSSELLALPTRSQLHIQEFIKRDRLRVCRPYLQIDFWTTTLREPPSASLMIRAVIPRRRSAGDRKLTDPSFTPSKPTGSVANILPATSPMRNN
jgi:hypothetical protein